jgi:hypothetical protein
LEPEWPTHGYDRHPPHRQRTTPRRAATSGAGKGNIRPCSCQPYAACKGDLRPGRSRRQGCHRPQPYGVKLWSVRGVDTQADQRDCAGLVDIQRWMSGRRGTRTSRRSGGSSYRSGARSGQLRALRARPRAARAGSPLARPSCGCRATLCPQYRHRQRARLLSRYTRHKNLELACGGELAAC